VDVTDSNLLHLARCRVQGVCRESAGAVSAAPPPTIFGVVVPSNVRPASEPSFETATRIALVVVLLVQAAAIVIAQPWPEGTILLVLSRSHGVTMGDLPALPLALLALGTAAGLRGA